MTEQAFVMCVWKNLTVQNQFIRYWYGMELKSL